MMKVLVTGSSGHLGSGLVKHLRDKGVDVVSIDIKEGEGTDYVVSILDSTTLRKIMEGVDTVVHTATLHKPHVATHAYSEFVDVNIKGTLNLLQISSELAVKSFVFTSTTSTFGDALVPERGKPSERIDEKTKIIPKNIYGVTKVSAEDLCRIFSRNHDLPCVVLRLSRFFQEEDDSPLARDLYNSDNLKCNEFLHRRVDIQDAVDAVVLAIEKAPKIKFSRLVISATTPFKNEDLEALRLDAKSVVSKHYPQLERIYESKGWKMYKSIDRVYFNDKARQVLGWRPKYNFAYVLNCIDSGLDYRSPLARYIGSKGYHEIDFWMGHIRLVTRNQT
ncbi:UDP-glucose 4-epimerase [Vibrio maritimus]|uniref:UDP-glucose 4-epimerase n=1 Tax=Vibrio maritimus TaxID=990268 RepID=A0A090S0R7_9VIBR|nr:UDP-glucose 4-epimerase [Vibrio maritimus]